jgi:hypothetical protein
MKGRREFRWDLKYVIRKEKKEKRSKKKKTISLK